MAALLEKFTTQHLLLISLFLTILIIILFIMCIVLFRYVKSLSTAIYTAQRDTDHKTDLMESALEQLAKDLPLQSHPSTLNKQKKDLVEEMLHDFSARLNKQIGSQLKSAQDIWNDKFSILVSLTGHTEQEIKSQRDDYFKDSWTSITELRKKSQLLFNDMQEDGVFYRLQSLLLLSELELQQSEDFEAFRHCSAAIKLYHDSKPRLPLSKKLIWKICETFIKAGEGTDINKQHETLKKFQITAKDIVDLYKDMYDFKNAETMDRLGEWSTNYNSI